MTAPALNARQIGIKASEGRWTLNDVSIELKQGGLAGLVGPNGSGKSTLLKVCAGLIKPNRGEVSLADNKPLAKLNAKQRARHIAYMPQNYQPHPFSVYDTVMMGRYSFTHRFNFTTDNDRLAVQKAIDQIGIAHIAERKFSTLSGGEQRLTVFARMLAQNADILLLDEPTADLDLKHRASLMQIVRREVSAGRSAVIAFHDLDLALRYCDCVYMLLEGRIFAQGAPRAVIIPPNIRTVFEVESAIVDDADDGLPHVKILN